MICSVKTFLKWCSMMECNSWTKVMLVNFSKKLPFGEVTHMPYGPKLCKLLSHDLLLHNFFEMLLQERTQQVDIINSQFCPKISFETNGKFGPNLGQNYATLYLMNRYKIFLWNVVGWWGLLDRQKLWKSIFQKNSLLRKIRPKFPYSCKLQNHDLFY